MAPRIRLGIIGAGNFARNRMLPNFKKLTDVDLTVVCNRRLESARSIADLFDIPDVTDNYRDVIERSDVDAIMIGTPPYLHREAVLASLDVGKHVLCQTRIALTPDEAREMHQAAQEAAKRGVKAMLARPAPYAKGSRYVRHLIDTGYVGPVHQVMGFCIWPNYADHMALLDPKQTNEVYGPFNAMQLGLYWDVMSAWVGPARRVLAQGQIFVNERPQSPDGPMGTVEKPDTITAIAETKTGAIVSNVQMWAGLFGANRIEIYGEKGTLVYQNQGDVLLGARAGDAALTPLEIPAEHDASWDVEAEFACLIRGEIAEPSFTFMDGVRNMEYLEAAQRSWTEERWVDLP